MAIGRGKEYPVQQIPHLICGIIAGRHRLWSSEARWLGTRLATVDRLPQRWLLGAGTAELRLFVLGGPARSGRWTRVGSVARPISALAGGDARVIGWARRLSAFSRASDRPTMCGPIPAICWRSGGSAGVIDRQRSKSCTRGWLRWQSRPAADASHWIDAAKVCGPARSRHAAT